MRFSKGPKMLIRMAEAAFGALGIDCNNVIVVSTGVIGVPLDIDAIAQACLLLQKPSLLTAEARCCRRLL